VTDLSAIGTEYLYAVVDAYDRPVPLDTAGQFEALNPIRDRLLGLFSQKVPEEDLSPATKDAWVFRVGGLPAEPQVQVTRTPGADASMPVMDDAGDQAPARSGAPGAADSQPPPAAQPAPQSDVLTTPPRS
jgi:hypothetical protein